MTAATFVSASGLLLAALLMPALAGAATFYPYVVNVANLGSYFNVSQDIEDMQNLTMIGNYAEAYRIYTAGKNAYRNFGNPSATPPVPPSFRFAFPLATAGNQFRHDGEPYYVAFSSYYNDKVFLDSWLGTSLNATGEFASVNANFRASFAAAAASIYGWVYILHEADAGYLFMKGYVSPTLNATGSPVRSVTASFNSAIAEIDDAYAVYWGKGASGPRAEALAAAQKACISSVAVDKQMQGTLDGFVRTQAAAVAFKTANTAVATDAQAAEFLAGRNDMVACITRSWVQKTLDSLRSAVKTSNANLKAGYQGTALASFRAVAPLINAQPNGARTVEVLDKAIASIKTNSFANARAAMNSFYRGMGVDFKKKVYGCN